MSAIGQSDNADVVGGKKKEGVSQQILTESGNPTPISFVLHSFASQGMLTDSNHFFAVGSAKEPSEAQNSTTSLGNEFMHLYEVRPRTDHRGVDLISDALPFDWLWYGEPNAVSKAIGYASQYTRSHDAVIRVYDEARNVIETHQHKADFVSLTPAGEFTDAMASDINNVLEKQSESRPHFFRLGGYGEARSMWQL
jgi:hypothetical protein